MVIKLYNTLTRKKEIFKPIKENEVGIYSCGPTVYWYQHIGNLRSYIFADILRRIFEYNQYKVKQVINVTDVGHLTSDADEGEDKMEKAAHKEGKKAEEISKFYFNEFEKDLKKINILKPSIWSWATEHIKEQIDLVKKLEKNKFTYRTKDGIYFDTSKLSDYGKLARLKIENLEAGKRVELRDKKNVTDFALWKFSEEIGKREQEWDSPWGIGFPGWHIECSAMSMKYLGENFDIHTGGIDHIPVHHTNEIAQSEAATGKKFVNYWMHGAFLTFKGEKVSKSKGGLLTISELEEKKIIPLSYRYFTFNAHYRKPLDFTLEGLQQSQVAYLRLKKIISEIEPDKKINKGYLKEFEEAINNDLDMPHALSVLWRLVRDPNAEGKIETIKEMDKVFGLKLLTKEEIEIPKEIEKLAKEREQARKNKDWEKSDDLRDRIVNLGWQVNDKKDGFEISKINQ